MQAEARQAGDGTEKAPTERAVTRENREAAIPAPTNHAITNTIEEQRVGAHRTRLHTEATMVGIKATEVANTQVKAVDTIEPAEGAEEYTARGTPGTTQDTEDTAENTPEDRIDGCRPQQSHP